MRHRVLLVLASSWLAAILPSPAIPQNQPQVSDSKVHAIVADEALFPAGFAATVDWKAMRAESRWKLWTAVPAEGRPRLADVTKKYGADSATVDETAPALRSGSMESIGLAAPTGVPTRQIRVYYFDHIGLGVDPADANALVLLITNRPAAGPK